MGGDARAQIRRGVWRHACPHRHPSVGEIANEVARAIVSKLIDEEVTTDEVKSALVKHAAE